MKQLCYKCNHNNSGEVQLDEFGNEFTTFDCDLFPKILVPQNFDIECKDFEKESRDKITKSKENKNE